METAEGAPVLASPTQGTPATAGQTGSPGTPPAEGDSQAPQATPPEQTGGQAGTQASLFKDLPSAERDYKALQAEYTRIRQAVSRLGDLPGVESRLALLGQLQADPRFLEWAKARVAEEQAGSGDPETVRALELVESIAERKAREYVAPLAAQAAQARIQGVFGEMDKKHGTEWHAYKPKMAEVFARGVQAGYFSPAANVNASLDFVEGLYAMATGSDPEYAARAYAKKLATKQSNTTQATPGTAPSAVATGPARSLDEAFAQAKRQVGMA